MRRASKRAVSCRLSFCIHSRNQEGIIRSKEASTGSALITVQRDKGENRIIVVPGSNMLLSTADIDHAAAEGFLDARVVVCQFEISGKSTLHALKLARQKGRMTILNPAPPPNKAPGNAELLPEMLKLCDYCCPNETEALQLISSAGDKNDTSAGIGSIDSYSHCLCWLAEHGVVNPIVTMGSKGLVALAAKSSIPVNLTKDVSVVRDVVVNGQKKCVVHVDAPHVPKVIDTTLAQNVKIKNCGVAVFAPYKTTSFQQ
ncbi:unnamed protein product [Echinostoma caproni]|uniref:PfkB domain-containing protein n=1 Tax=Echinostoma caproni TaxID=27848 RepID=A0A183AP91_9TREM|nr:unnamed protein product [Echinostoma caproni]